MAPRSARGAAESACSWDSRRSLTARSRPASCWWEVRWCSSSGRHSSDARAADLTPAIRGAGAAGATAANGGVRGRPADAVQPVAHETRDRIVTGLVTVVPILLLGLAA